MAPRKGERFAIETLEHDGDGLTVTFVNHFIFDHVQPDGTWFCYEAAHRDYPVEIDRGKMSLIITSGNLPPEGTTR